MRYAKDCAKNYEEQRAIFSQQGPRKKPKLVQFKDIPQARTVSVTTPPCGARVPDARLLSPQPTNYITMDDQ